jgi:signal transduction histidine kinase
MIEDDGKGFDIHHQTAGFGQSTVRERAKAIGANLIIDSEPGKGTRIRLVWKSRS